MKYQAQRALALLREGTGRADAQFREGQEDAIRHVVKGLGRLLVVQKTGWGKSFVYFIATKLLRESGTGPALLISPLLALMRNQIAAAERMGVKAVRIASDNREDQRGVGEQLRRDEVDILLITPEQLKNQRFGEEVLAGIADRIALFVVDEAHCISDWGHDFRPDYRRIGRTIKNLPPNLRLLATTATANNRVMEDLGEVLGPNLEVQLGNLARPSLLLQTIRLPRQVERLAWLAEQVPKLGGHGIIYTLTVRDAHQVAAWLQSRGIEVGAYTGRTRNNRCLEQALLDNRVKALVATTALGMGFDKPDLGFVIHYQSPASVVHYYQQVGRAGRALDAAYGVLLSGEEETDIADYFIRSAFPTPHEVQQVISALERTPDGLSIADLLGKVNISKGRIEKTMALLSLESPAPIIKEGSQWQLTAVELSADFRERAERLTRLRRDEQRQMQEYVALKSGHMEFLIRALDGDPGTACLPDLPLLPTQAAPNLVQDAVVFLRRTSLGIEPRRQWPGGGMPQYQVRGNIPAARRAEPGKALCTWSDTGWEEVVRRCKYQDHRFADKLVSACVSLMAGWRPNPAPQWVTCIPSRRRPNLVPDFAARLARQLDLPFHRVLHRAKDRPEQKTMANSTQQARNVDGSLVVSGEPLPRSPVLLVDDMADSRWTLTVAAWLLRSHGSGKVWPLALALTNRG
ncbi:MAG: RecQ family ATP-dependent DNA helicase [Cyanobacteria bacterium MAG CAR3_bin_5]|nr:RecQ family ATP-dependent DNA helicase [Cyanobacteria bacterium MAG CAR3_bin_5]